MDDYATRLSIAPGITLADEQVATIRQQRAEQQQAAQQLQMAQMAADGAKTLSETQMTEPSALAALMGM